VIIAGPALKYDDADDVNTDVIWPGKYTYVQIPPEEMPRYAMETFDPDFPQRVVGRRVLVVGKNFGCGSSREQASECLLHSGIQAIVARSFARIFYRNSINLGMAVIESPAAVDAIADGDAVEIDLAAGRLALVGGEAFDFERYPEFVLRLIEDGGLIEHIRKRKQGT
jgi:3-isopropylmalate/(R)-2-methylmalate dehydratase small subunit